MSVCKRCKWEYRDGYLCSEKGLCDSCKEIALQEECDALRTDRDELRATLSGLCSYLGASVPDATTTAAEMNRLIHAGIKRREEAVRDEVRQFLRGQS